MSSAAGQPQRAAYLLAACAAICRQMDVPVPPVDRAVYDHTLARVRGQLGSAFETNWQEGLAWNREQAVAYVLKAPVTAERPA